ncbi:hypothetical protein MHU86_15740 [Fragilaria crotonensis]|nr:hypothetical protein MHU86_15740 [Fragilaria crotonensis]
MSDRTSPANISLWALHGERPADFVSKDAWPRQLPPSRHQQRLWKRYISSQFLRYDRKWRAMPTLLSPGRDTPDPVQPIYPQQSRPLMSYLKGLPRNKKRLLTHIQFPEHEDRIWRECQRKQTLTIASDGGLKGRHGTFGWSLTTPQNTILCEGAGPVDGPFDTANSTRCELGGYAAALLLISLLQRSWGKRHQCTFRWVTDSKSAIRNVQSHTQQRQIKERQPSNPDYMSIIKHEGKFIRRKISHVWVKGHQLDTSQTPRGTPKKDVARNSHVDHLATWYREHSHKRQSIEKTDHTPEAKITISVNGVRLVSQIESCLRFHINGYHLRSYVQSKHKWTNSIWDRIDVEAYGRFHRRLSPSAQVAQTKFMFDQRNTGKVRCRNAKVSDPKLSLCPCCKTQLETTHHVLRCRMNTEHENGMLRLRTSLSSAGPHPVFHLITEKVFEWLEHRGNSDAAFHVKEFPAKFHDSIRAALSDQQEIGWDNAIKGYLSVEWRNMAEEGLFDTDTSRSRLGYQRLQVIFKALHIYHQTVWKARNHTLHNTQTMEIRQIRDTELFEITDLYEKSDRLRAGDRHYCEQPLEEILKKSPSSRRRWLLLFMKRAIHRASTDGKRQTLMTSFFRPSVTTGTDTGTRSDGPTISCN